MRTPGVSKGIFSAAGNRWRPGLPVALFILLASIYMLTWSGRINSQDARLMLNASSSLVRFGDMRADLAAGETPPAPGKLATEQGVRSLPEIQVEPLQPLLAAPLYWLALHVPGAGLAHGVYLFNVLVCAAAGSLMFLYSRRLGYSEAAAVLAALALGLATIVWTYSDSFFQAPLAMLFILLAACQLEQLREGGRRRPAAVLMAALTLLLMPFARHSTLLALPALVIIAVPTVDLRPATRRWLLPAIPVAVVLMPVLLILLLQNSSILQHLPGLPDWIGPGHYAGVIHSYLLSPGGSLWGTSPVLLLALPGAWLLWRAGKRRHVLAALVLVATFALVFAWWQGVHWFGGLSWPPRFLIPVVPLVLLTAMPVLERLTQSSRSRWLLPAVALLAAGSLWVQLGAISLPWEVYGHALPPEAGGHGDWSGGLNLLRWMRWIVIPGLWSSMAWDFAWIRTGTLTWPLLFGGSALYAAWRIRRHFGVAGVAGARAPRLTTLLHLAGMLALMFAGLALLPPDPLYDAPNEALDGLLQRLGRESAADDIVLLSDLELERYLANYGKLTRPRLVSLPFHPGEKGSPEQAATIVSDNPEVLLHASAAQQITALANSRDRIWLLAANSPWLPWAVRPVERYMARNYYPLREIESGPRARLLEYDTTPAPDPLVPGVPDWRASLRYGEHIRLTGYSLPRGQQLKPGDSLPVTLFWHSDAPLEHSWTVAWFLAAPGSPPALQGWDSAPQAGFAPTSGWTRGVTQLDNRAMRLPHTLPAGDYQILVVLYRMDEAGGIVRLPVRGADTRDGYVGVLPTRLQVGQGD